MKVCCPSCLKMVGYHPDREATPVKCPGCGGAVTFPPVLPASRAEREGSGSAPYVRNPPPVSMRRVAWRLFCVAAVAILATGGCSYLLSTWRVKGCRHVLRTSIAYGCREYAETHDGAYPAELTCEANQSFCCGKCVSCPSVDYRTPSFVYELHLREDMPDDFIVAYDKLGNHWGGRNVLYLSRRVEWWPSSREAELASRIEEQRKVIRRWREAGAKKEDISKFFGALNEKIPK